MGRTKTGRILHTTPINELLGRMGFSLSREKIADTTLEIMKSTMKHSPCALFFVDEEKRELYVHKSIGFPEETNGLRISLANENSMVARVVHAREPYYAPHVSEDSLHPFCGKDVKTVFAVPLLISDRLYGVLAIGSRKEDAFSPQERESIELVASSAALAFDNASHFETLTTSNQMKETLLSIMSHDLKNPLQSVYGYAELLKGKVEESSRPYVERIEEAVHKMDTLITNVRLYSKLEAGTYVENFEDADLCTIILAALKNVEHERKKKTIEIQFAPLPCIIKALSITEIIFVNLLDNAIKYSPEGGKIEIELSEMKGYARVKIKEKGEGISLLYKSLLSRGFQSTEEMKEIGSAGLGLALVCRIVELHKGTVQAEENDLQGGMVIVELPKER